MHLMSDDTRTYDLDDRLEEQYPGAGLVIAILASTGVWLLIAWVIRRILEEV